MGWALEMERRGGYPPKWALELERLGHDSNIGAQLVDRGLRAAGSGCIAEDGRLTPEAATPAAYAFLRAVASGVSDWCTLLDFDVFSDEPSAEDLARPERLREVVPRPLSEAELDELARGAR